MQLNDIQTRLSSLTGAAPGQTGDKSPYLHEMKTNLDDVQNGIRALLSKAQVSYQTLVKRTQACQWRQVFVSPFELLQVV